MNRDISKLNSKSYDVLVIGAGIAGAAVALDAAQRGLAVLIVDKGDFGSATSASSGKIIHGGIRFMQHAAFLRVRESLHHRRVFLNIAPHLVHPIPFIIPTYGHGIKGKEILTAGMMVYELLGIDKNITKDPSKKVPRFKILSKEEVLKLEPGINSDGLTGGVLYYDCQMHTPERLTLAIIQTAKENGAEVFNYVKVNSLITEKNNVIGAELVDLLSGDIIKINSLYTINAAGPWLNKILDMVPSTKAMKQIQFSKGIHLVTEPITKNHAIALATKHQQAKSILTRGGRHFFIAPWKKLSLIGTTNVNFNGDQDDKMVTKEDIEEFLDEIKQVYKPADRITLKDVRYSYGGLYIDDANIKFISGYQGHRNDQILDHQEQDKINRLLSVIAVKYTTSLQLAEKIIDLIVKRLGKGNVKSVLEYQPLFGGDIIDYSKFVKNAKNKYSDKLEEVIIENLILLHGTKYEEVINIGSSNNCLFEKFDEESPYIKAQILYSIKFEMAVKLSDVFLRRIGLGTLKKPEDVTIETVANIMAEELLWDNERIQLEIDEVNSIYALN